MVINILDSSDKDGEKFVILEANINDIYDLVNGVNLLVAKKEEEIIKYNGDQIDKNQLTRYKLVLKSLQDIKGKIK